MSIEQTTPATDTDVDGTTTGTDHEGAAITADPAAGNAGVGTTDTDEDAGSGEDDVTHVTSSSQEDLVRQGEIAADFLESLLDIADLDGDLEVDVEGNRAAVAIVDSEDGAAPRRLVGPGGVVLEALQELTRLAVQAETGERSRLMLDVAGYRADRRVTLVKTARRAIAEVQESGARRELEPMTAFERKVVHDEVLAAGLVSESEGAEPARYVVILPAR
ncbi:protein jag [Ornithinimicrobium flavum]|uniref:Jag family protein n=1 Tax=Ornithinimicrobium flavum TaxID=1288636 RepID=UPI001EE8F800|nr:R3H domain-containing nucleic acid-binding protein [Ornithinimicrobium flavum]